MVTDSRRIAFGRPMLLAALLTTLCGGLAGAPRALAQADAVPAHGIAMHGEPKYGPDFEHFDYVNPDAPKGGAITIRAIGTFNTFNPYILEGDSYYTSWGGDDRFYETLLTSSDDEAFSEYCLLCETVETPADRSYVQFVLRENAAWSDGTPVTVEDVIFSYETLLAKGHPFYQDYWGSIVSATKVGDRGVRFDFEEAEEQNRELPLIAGQMPIFQQAWWAGREFDVPTLDVPVSSGPYRIVDVEPGVSFTFERNPDYWGKDLPVNVGRYNYDRITVDYYRDTTVALEAFKAGEYDVQFENNSKNWATAYDFPAVSSGQVTLANIPDQAVNGMQGFFFNLRRPIFADRDVRKALGYAFDFEWSNKNLFYDQYTRTKSYWDNSELAYPGGAPTGKVAEYLEPWRDQLPAEVYGDESYEPPSTGGTEDGLRENLATALSILEGAGWTVNDAGVLVNAAGEAFTFEILLDDQSWERIAQPFIDNLERLGIDASMRTVDPSQWQERADQFDIDMIVYNRGMSASPGNEQRNYWTCDSSKTPGSQNYWGLCNEAIDQLVENVVQASDRVDLVAATQALDRALQWEYLTVPHWHIRSTRVAYWNVIDRPERSPSNGPDFDSWWYKDEAADAIRAAQAELEFVDPGTAEAEAAAAEATPETGAEEAATDTTDDAAAETEAETETESSGGVPGGPIGIALALILALGAIFALTRKRD